MAIIVVALVVLAIVATPALVLQMSLIWRGGWKRVSRRSVFAAFVVFTLAITSTSSIWWILVTSQLSSDTKFGISLLLLYPVTIAQLDLIYVFTGLAVKRLMELDKGMTFSDVIKQALKL